MIITFLRFSNCENYEIKLWLWNCVFRNFKKSIFHNFLLLTNQKPEVRDLKRFKNLPEIEIFEIFQQSENAILQVAQSVAIKLKCSQLLTRRKWSFFGFILIGKLLSTKNGLKTNVRIYRLLENRLSENGDSSKIDCPKILS